MSNFYTIQPKVDWDEPSSFTPGFSNVSKNHSIGDGGISDLKVADDGEIYLADNAPDFLFEAWERKRMALIGIDISVPSGSSKDAENSNSPEDKSAAKKSSSKGSDEAEDLDAVEKKKDRRSHRSSLMKVCGGSSSRRLTKNSSSGEGENETKSKSQGGRNDGLVKSESKRLLTKSSSFRKNVSKRDLYSGEAGLLDDIGDGPSKRGVSRSSSLRKNLPKWEKGNEDGLLDDIGKDKSLVKSESKRGLVKTSSIRKDVPKWEKSKNSLLDDDIELLDDIEIDTTIVKSESKRGLVRSSSQRKNLPKWEASNESMLDNEKSVRKSRTSGSTTSISSSSAHQQTTSDAFFKIIDLNPSKYKQKLDEDKFIDFIQKNPNMCSQKYEFSGCDSEKLYPLHMICAMGASLNTVKICYKMYAEAIDYVGSEKGMTCLHYAAWYTRAPLDVIQFLVKKEPDAVKALTKKHRTPLHLACLCPPTFKLHNPQVAMILTEIGGPGLCLQVDKHGRTPLHCACCLDEPSVEVVEDLTDVNPDACLVQCQDYQSTPLHIACSNANVQDENSTVVDVIKDLTRSNPDAVRLKDKDDQLPIFVAVTNRACLKVLKMLVRKYPDSLETLWHGMIVHELAKKLKLDEETVSFLDPYEDDE